MKRLFALMLALVLCASTLPASAAVQADFAPSEAIIQFIANQEGFRAYAHSSGGRLYIGYGTQVKSGEYPNGISREKALELLEADISSYTWLVNRFAAKYGVALTQNQFDALVSLSYNVSTKWMSADSTLGALLIKGSYTDLQFMNAFGSWCHAGGKALTGLVLRRIREAKIFLYGDYGDLNYLYYYGEDDAALAALRKELQTLREGNEENEENEVLTEEEYLAREEALTDRIAAPQEAVSEERGPEYKEDSARDFTYLRYDGGKGYEDDDIIYYAKNQPYGEFGGAYRKGYKLAAWATEDGTYLLPTDTATGAKAVKAVWTTGEADRKYLSVSPFSDVSIYAWYYEGLQQASSAGIVSGYADGSFRPEKEVTVGAVLKMLMLAAGYSAQKTVNGSAFEGYKTLALKDGLATKEELTDLSASATRLFVARFAARAMGLAAGEGKSPYADTDDPLATALYTTGVMVGSVQDGKTVLLGDKPVRRLEMAVIVSRILQYREV